MPPAGDPPEDFPWLDETEFVRFPPPEASNSDGILAFGGNLSPGMLLSAYKQGIFPWFSDGDPILWWCPDPRFVIQPDRLHVSRSLRRTLRSGRYHCTFDTSFADVISQCARVERRGQDGTWITDDMADAYLRLHELGFAHSCETWEGDLLVGGAYGVSLGRVFFGESMFSVASDASKVALVTIVRTLEQRGFGLIDSQVRTNHVASMGGIDIPRDEFLVRLAEGLSHDTIRGDWSLLLDVAAPSDQ